MLNVALLYPWNPLAERSIGQHPQLFAHLSQFRQACIHPARKAAPLRVDRVTVDKRPLFTRLSRPLQTKKTRMIEIDPSQNLKYAYRSSIYTSTMIY